MREITATVPAYMFKFASVYELMNENPQKAITRMAIGGVGSEDWVWIGSAIVTVEIADDDEIKAGLIESLKDAKKKIQASAEKSITEIDSKIQSLLAIEYKG